MWDLIVSVPDHCLSFYFSEFCLCLISCEFICGLRSYFVFALILTRCRFGQLNNTVRSFLTVVALD